MNKSLTKLQKDIIDWAGDSDGGCPWQTVVEFLMKDGYNELDIKKEIISLIKSKNLISSNPSCQLHSPKHRPNECKQILYENKKGYTRKQEKTILVPDKEIEVSGYIVTTPKGEEEFYESLSEIEKQTDLSAKMISKHFKGFANILPYRVRTGITKKLFKGGPKKVMVDTFVPPSKDPLYYEKEIMGNKNE